MTITTEKVGKRFGKHWLFRDIDLTIQSGESLAITGRNGSGKSTLLRILSGYLSPSEGKVYHNEKEVNADTFHQFCFVAPYVEVPEEMNFREFLGFHSTFRKPTLGIEEISSKSGLPLNKPISDFSTGMKQRVQLCTAFYFENQAIFMDEPTSNLDEQGFEWWEAETQALIDVPIILASNQKKEVTLCRKKITL